MNNSHAYTGCMIESWTRKWTRRFHKPPHQVKTTRVFFSKAKRISVLYLESRAIFSNSCPWLNSCLACLLTVHKGGYSVELSLSLGDPRHPLLLSWLLQVICQVSRESVNTTCLIYSEAVLVWALRAEHTLRHETFPDTAAIQKPILYPKAFDLESLILGTGHMYVRMYVYVQGM